jgi:hypothetical protein
MRNRKRQRGESIQALAQDIHRLVQRSYPEIGRLRLEGLSVERFREALPDHEQLHNL